MNESLENDIVTDTELFVYNRHLQQVSRHPLWQGPTGS
jgi:hypothetical protein